MGVILLSSDLMIVSHVEGAARQTGVTVQTVSNVGQVGELCAAGDVQLVIVDLAMPSLDVAALVNSLKSGKTAAPRIVAFGPHVHAERLDAARQAGCDEVISRGQFFAQVGSILRS